MCSSKFTIKTFGSTTHNSLREYKDVSEDSKSIKLILNLT